MSKRLRSLRRPSVLRRIYAPLRLRTLIRRSEIAYTCLAALVGAISGAAVVGMQELIHLLGLWVFASEQDISGATGVPAVRILLAPVAGGILLGLSYLIARKWFRRVADPIEANAVGGGKLPIFGSLFIALQTIASSGFGASVGMEAAYTQIASAVASWGGQRLRLRREDLRQLVAAGAGGAIAAAFDAPLTGAFYAFELVLAAYSVAALLPVLAASLAATAIARLLSETHGWTLYFAGDIAPTAYLPIAILSVAAAFVGIGIMRSVSVVEGGLQRLRVPFWAMPVVGGLCVGLLALITPHVLSSGHGSMDIILNANLSYGMLASIFVLKSLASVISLGSGFRGGLFFASLLLGAILGKLLAIFWMIAFGLNLPIVIFAVVGMCAMATSIIGAPLAMSFLALETTQSLPLTLAVLFAALLSTALVRRFFGFSFSTWRFHLRGETIRSAADIGWMRDLTVGRLMRRVNNGLLKNTTIADARRRYPLGATKAIPLTDEAGTYAGMCIITDLHWDGLDPKETVASIARLREAWLRPEQSVKEAIDAFGKAEADSLAVLDAEMKILGTVNEHYCLRRYADETNRRLYPERT